MVPLHWWPKHICQLYKLLQHNCFPGAQSSLAAWQFCEVVLLQIQYKHGENVAKLEDSEDLPRHDYLNSKLNGEECKIVIYERCL